MVDSASDASIGVGQTCPHERRRIALGALAIGGVSVLKIGLQLALLPIMARLLGPAEFGLYALALPVVGFLLMLADGGLATSLARESEDNRAAWSSAFWALMASAVVLAGVSIAIAYPIAAFAEQPRLPALVAALSASFLFSSLSVSPLARLMREGRLGITAVADFVATGVGAAAAIGLAWKGAGAWSLALQFLTVFCIRACFMNLAAPAAPSLTFNWKALKPHLAMGASVVGVKLSDYLGKLAENAMFGRYLGAATLGGWSLANQIPRFLCDVVQNPAWANLNVRTLRSGGAEAAEAYYRTVRITALLLLPSSMLFAAAAEPLVTMLLGDAWRAAGPLMAILLPATAVATVGYMSSAALYALGRSDIQFWTSAGFAAVRLAIVACASFIGATGVAWGVAAAAVVYAVAGVVVPAPLIGSRPLVVLKLVFWPLVASAGVAKLASVVLHQHPLGLIGLVAVEAAGALLVLALLAVFDRKRLQHDLAEAKSLLSRQGR